MKISVITVAFNSASTIADTIRSVANQINVDKEHIVVDGLSNDGTVEIIQNSSSISKYVSERDDGIYDAMNKGIALATGDVVGILNADDFYIDETVLAQVAQVFLDSQVDACYADLVYVDPINTNKIIRYWRSHIFKEKLFKKGWMPAHPTFFVRRSVYERFGVFNLSFPRQADFELTMRFLEIAKIKSVYIPRIWVKMRTGGVSNNSISGIIKGNIEAYRACKVNNLNVGIFFIPRKILSRLPQYFQRPD